MNVCLGLDTSCYSTSVALAWTDQGKLCYDQERRPLDVPSGARGLQQSEMVFQHVKRLPELMETLLARHPVRIDSVCASLRPRPAPESYMPAFRVGEGYARTVAAALDIPFIETSHQHGHIRAAMIETPLTFWDDFLALHLSGGTTEMLLVRGQGDLGEEKNELRANAVAWEEDEEMAGRDPSFFLEKKKEAKKNLLGETNRTDFEARNPLCKKSKGSADASKTTAALECIAPCHNSCVVTNVELLGGTKDLHAGQMIDRVGVRLGLPFPAGPSLAALAVRGRAFSLLSTSLQGLDCHFSGAEAQAFRMMDAEIISPEDIAAEVFSCVARTVARLILAGCEKTGKTDVLVGGGVASSELIRNETLSRVDKRNRHIHVFFGKPELSGDNAVGVACIGLEGARGTPRAAPFRNA